MYVYTYFLLQFFDGEVGQFVSIQAPSTQQQDLSKFVSLSDFDILC